MVITMDTQTTDLTNMQDTTSDTPSTQPINEIPLEECRASTENYVNGPLKLERDEFGLLKNVNYKFTPEGWVDWRSMIDPKFLYPNKDWFEARGLEVPDSIDVLEDAQLLIQLGGIKELARLRGFLGVSYELTHINEKTVAAQCTIDWIPNYENPNGVRFESTANATTENTNGFGAKFLEAIAENRAFVRAVRNFLNIHIVGADEMDKSKNKLAEIEETAQTVVSLTAQSSLEKQAANAGFKTFESFRADFLDPLAKSGGYTPAKKPENKWKTYAEIPADECRKIITLIKENK